MAAFVVAWSGPAGCSASWSQSFRLPTAPQLFTKVVGGALGDMRVDVVALQFDGTWWPGGTHTNLF